MRALLLIALAAAATEQATATVEVVQAAQVELTLDGGLHAEAPANQVQVNGQMVVFE